jgi:hypothetical protein
VKPGEAWGEPAAGPADLVVTGTDAELAAALGAASGALVQFLPDRDSDLARAVGLHAAGEPQHLAVPVDAMTVEPGGPAVNAVVVGTPPGALRATSRSRRVRVAVDGRVVADGPATTVVVASGQFVDGLDVVPRGHPGDGRLEVQVYALRRGERRAMRARLPRGTHLPHPRITTAVGKAVTIEVEGGGLPVVVDGVTRAPEARVTVTVVPAAFRLLV